MESGRHLTVTYRQGDQSYSQEGLEKINRLFGVSKQGETIALRLIALLDYIEDNYRTRPIKIRSGYRSFEENEKLRRAGKLAGKASLHMDGMAADLQLTIPLAGRIWKELRDKKCCGVGYYHTNTLHLDTGKPRFWDEKSSKTGTDIAEHNKHLFLTTDFDLYHSADKILFSFVQVTDYPFGLKEIILIPESGSSQSVSLFVAKEGCQLIRDRESTHHLLAPLPEISFKRGRLKALFCQKPFPEMPDEVVSNPLEFEGGRE
ncbi:MAG: DUF882 domain-containing protein, partial [Deltaproteobacteria bacterium]|nr:DUF882 domain-containing protein [Deltaproteobacteria bacterium]